MHQLLVYRKGQLLGRYELHAGELVVGRGGHVVLDAPDVSRLHALLAWRDDAWTVTDLGSLNGLTVNGEPTAERTLATGDRLGMGSFELKCEFSGPGPTLAAPPLVAREGLDETLPPVEAGASLILPGRSIRAARPSTGDRSVVSERTVEAAALAAVAAQAAHSRQIARSKVIPAANADAPAAPAQAAVPAAAPAKPEASDQPAEKPAKPDEKAAKPDKPAKPDEKAAKPADKAERPADKPAKPDKPAPKKEAKREAVGEDVRRAYERYFGRLRRLARSDVEWTKEHKPTQVDLTYMARRSPRRRKLRAAWLVAVLAAGAWLGVSWARDDKLIYTGGSLSRGHTLFGNDCAACHVVPFRLQVPDVTCLACHRELIGPRQVKELEQVLGGQERPAQLHPLDPAVGPLMAARWPTHHENQARTPFCAECHPEHEGNALLTWQVGDRDCVGCHKALGPSIAAGASATVVLRGGLTVESLATHPDLAFFASGEELTLAPAGSSASRRLALGKQAEPARDGTGQQLEGRRDRARLFLNHARHLLAQLPAMDTPTRQAWVQEVGRDHMECADCHQPAGDGARFQPIQYEQHCQACHPLRLPPMVGAERDTAWVGSHGLSQPWPVPHGLSGEALVSLVRGARLEERVEGFYRDYARDHPEERAGSAPAPGPPGPRRPGPPGRPPGGPAGAAAQGPVSEAEWAAKRLARWKGDGGPGRALWELLFSEVRDGCARCHTLEHPTLTGIDPGLAAADQRTALLAQADLGLGTALLAGESPPPTVVPPEVPARWLDHARFDHRAHAVFSCAECHSAANGSQETADVLLPRMKSCVDCHKAGPLSTCVTCHPYHDRGPELVGSAGKLGRASLVRRK